jgi:HSP20 family molecular chaperone IbpA
MDTDAHRIAIEPVDHIDPGIETAPEAAPANLYRSANYVVLDLALPLCLPQHIQVALAPDAVLVTAQRHPGAEAAEEGRAYLVQELSAGALRRSFPLPDADLALHEAEAHFGNGLLTVSIPTASRDAERHAARLS